MIRSVLQLHASAGLYGAETVILNLSEALKQQGYNSTVGCLMDMGKTKPGLGKEAEGNGLDVEYFPMRMRFDPFVVRKIVEFIRQKDIQIIHAHGYKSNFLGLIASKACHVPIIATNHLFPPMPLNDKRLQFYASFDAFFTMRRLQRIVAVSEDIKEKLIKKGVKGSKIVVIENGIDLDEYNVTIGFDKFALRKSLGIKNDAFIVGTLGRLTPQKGHTYLLEAAKQILLTGRHIVFLIAGDGPLKGQLEGFAKQLGIAESVKFLGFRRDTANLLRMLDVFVLPSIDEGLPMAMLEAMAVQVPVIATPVGDIPKVITNNKNGILVEKCNSEMLTCQITFLLKNKAISNEIAANAFEHVRRYYSKEAMCKKYLDIYEALVDKGMRISLS